jgi:hypothetical protein
MRFRPLRTVTGLALLGVGGWLFAACGRTTSNDDDDGSTLGSGGTGGETDGGDGDGDEGGRGAGDGDSGGSGLGGHDQGDDTPCPESYEPGGMCTGSAACRYGQECCGGTCYASVQCWCTGDTWSCGNTDACFGFFLPEGACRTTAGCAGGELCLAPDGQNCGVCQSFTSCEADEQCSTEGDVCSEGFNLSCPCDESGPVCVPACADDSACKAGWSCVEGHCENECSGDEDCRASFECNDGKMCERMTCDNDGECPQSGPCVGGQCYEEYGTCVMPAP